MAASRRAGERTVGDFGGTRRNSLDGGRGSHGDALGVEPVTNVFVLVVLAVVLVHFVQRISLLPRHRTLRTSAPARSCVAADAWLHTDGILKLIVLRLTLGRWILAVTRAVNGGVFSLCVAGFLALLGAERSREIDVVGEDWGFGLDAADVFEAVGSVFCLGCCGGSHEADEEGESRHVASV